MSPNKASIALVFCACSVVRSVPRSSRRSSCRWALVSAFASAFAVAACCPFWRGRGCLFVLYNWGVLQDPLSQMAQMVQMAPMTFGTSVLARIIRANWNEEPWFGIACSFSSCFSEASHALCASSVWGDETSLCVAPSHDVSSPGQGFWGTRSRFSIMVQRIFVFIFVSAQATQR